MFSSNPSISNINPNANPSFSSYLHCAPLFAGGYGNGDVLLNHHHQQLDPLTGGFVLPAANHHQYLTNMAFTTGYGINSNTAVINTSNFMGNNNKKVMKKDRHSKICTAQGLRDRRVRLSIDIAREFFDLQDMLGFDKPSKTLEWLLNKSRNAIKELTELRNINVDDCELEEAATTTDSRSCNKQMEGISEERKIMEKLTKESRDKARARARQRTRDKLCKKIAESSNSYAVVSHDHDHNQVQEPCSHSLANQAPTEYERKQNPSSNFAYEQQNLEISNTSSYDFNLPQNWDIISSAMPHQYYSTSFRAITKHESSK